MVFELIYLFCKNTIKEFFLFLNTKSYFQRILILIWTLLPFFMMISWYVGSIVLSSAGSTTLTFSLDSFLNTVTEKFLELFIGSILLFPIITAIVYFPVFYVLKSWKLRKSLNRKKI